MISNYKIYDTSVPCNLSKLRFTLYHVIDFVESKFIKVPNQRIFKL